MVSDPKCAKPWTAGLTISQAKALRGAGARVIFARDLLNTLRQRELDATAARLSAETGYSHTPSLEGERIVGVYRQRVTLASGRFAMIDDGLGFHLVPWRPAFEQHLDRQVSGVAASGGSVTWSFGRKIGLGSELRDSPALPRQCRPQSRLTPSGSTMQSRSAFVRRSIRTHDGCD